MDTDLDTELEQELVLCLCLVTKQKAGTETMITPGSEPVQKRAVASDENSHHTGTTQSRSLI